MTTTTITDKLEHKSRTTTVSKDSLIKKWGMEEMTIAYDLSVLLLSVPRSPLGAGYNNTAR
jgi:hypothetical protein